MKPLPLHLLPFIRMLRHYSFKEPDIRLTVPLAQALMGCSLPKQEGLVSAPLFMDKLTYIRLRTRRY
jgi:hypothetical protein